MSIDFNTKRTWGPKPNYPLVEKYKRPNKDFIFVAGPCSVESHNQINNLAVIAGMHGATHLRGGVYRAGTYPPDIKGLIAHELIESYMHASEVNDLQNIIEVIDLTEIEYLNGYSHCFQVGARQMQNYGLLRQFSNYPGTVFLKRNPGATIDEWLGSAEYLLQGNCDVVLVERGSSLLSLPQPLSAPSLLFCPGLDSMSSDPQLSLVGQQSQTSV